MVLDMNWVIEQYGAYFAVLGSQGDRASMEDNFAVYSSLPGVDLPNIFAVFDGHGGADCAAYCKEALPQIISQHPELKNDPKRAITESFLEVDQQYCRLASRSVPLDDGSTASLLYVQPTFQDLNASRKRKPHTSRKRFKFYLAACGDSRAILVKKSGQVVALSHDHDLKRKDEANRIRKAGGQIRHDGYGSRVVGENVGELAVTRAIGDVDFKSIGVTGEPEIHEGYLTEEDAYVIIASDGLWNQIPNEECGTILTSKKAQNAKLSTLIEQLIKLAKKRDNQVSNKFNEELSCDNITVLGVNVEKLLNRLPHRCNDVLHYQEDQRTRKQTLVLRGLSPYGYTSELLLWRNPMRSFCWVVVGTLLYFLTQVAEYNLITLLCILCLTQLIVDTTVVNFTPLLRKLKLVGNEFDSTIFLNEGKFVTEEVVDRTSELVSSEYIKFEHSFKPVVQHGGAWMVIDFIRSVSFLFTPFSLGTLLYIAFLSSFSLFVTYERNKTLCDNLYQRMYAKFLDMLVMFGLAKKPRRELRI